jgi:apolipoprotein N-acyltransferase
MFMGFRAIAEVVISAIMTVLAFPPFDWNIFLFMAPALGWRHLYQGSPFSRALASGLWGFTFAFGLGLYMIPTFTRHLHLLTAGWLGWGLALVWMFLWHAIWGWLIIYLPFRGGAWMFVATSLWVVIAWMRSLGTLGFPVAMLSLALTDWPMWVQPAEIGGIWLVEWLIVFWNTGLIVFKELNINKKIFIFMFLLIWFFYGVYKIWCPTKVESLNRFITVGVTQTGIYRSGTKENIYYKRLESLIRQAVSHKAQWLIFNEGVEPVIAVACTREDKQRLKRWRHWASTYHINLLIGLYTVDSRSKEPVVRNQACLLSEEKNHTCHEKTKLVPFIEWQPQSMRGWLRSMGIEERNLHPAVYPKILNAPNQPSVGPLLCMEILFGWVARQQVRSGAQWLAVMASDEWLIGDAVRQQYADFCVVRAIETRRWIARASPVGISGFYAPTGKLVCQLPMDKPGVLVQPIVPCADQTLYVRWGDWWVYLCLALVGISCLWCLARAILKAWG